MSRDELLIKNGTVVKLGGRQQADIAIKDGKISRIAPSGLLTNAEKVIDAQGLYVLPGLIDAHVHFRDPGFTYKEDFSSGARSALYGGITYAVDMPNVNPVTSTSQRLRERQALARQKACMDMGFFALLTSENLDEMEALQAEGAIGYKIYLGTSVGNIAAPGDGVMLDMFRKAATLGMRIGFHAENNAINDYYTQKAMNATKANDISALVCARPDFSEVEAVEKALAFARETGAKIHIYHVSSAKTVQVIARAQNEGVDVSAETCPQYLLLDQRDYARLGTVMKVYPTIKTPDDRRALWQGIRDGVIGMIATDHAPHTAEEKAGDVWHAMAGVAGVEISARLMLTQVANGYLTLENFAALMSENPARIWNLKSRGLLEEGVPANITIVDMNRRDYIHNRALHGRSNVTAFDDVETVGAPVMSVLNGKLFYL